jgi:hypothetical protein
MVGWRVDNNEIQRRAAAQRDTGSTRPDILIEKK